MKKLVFASAMALASISLVSTPALRAQDAGQITIQDPAEFNAYQNAITQTDPPKRLLRSRVFSPPIRRASSRRPFSTVDRLLQPDQPAGQDD